MIRILRLLGASAIVSGLLIAQPANLFPLAKLNSWVYREVGGTQTFEVRVLEGLGAANGNVYYGVRGYVDNNDLVWVRTGEDGSLYYYDYETGSDFVLTSFERNSGGWTNAPFRACEQESRVDPTPRKTHRFGTSEGISVGLMYRSFNCADAGTIEEEYVENIGMIRRTVQTIAGPRTYELVSARLGDLSVTTSTGGRFQIGLSRSKGGLLVDMRLMFDGSPEPYKLVFPTSQEFEIVVGDSKGKLYRWSEGKAFAQAVHERLVSRELRLSEEIPLVDILGKPLPPGRYVLEAWLTTAPYQREFFAAAPFEIPEEK